MDSSRGQLPSAPKRSQCAPIRAQGPGSAHYPLQGILKGVPERIKRNCAFGEGEGGFSGWSRAKVRLDEAKLKEEWTLHDLRRTAATRMADLGVQPIVEAVLNHVSGHKAGVAGIYNRSAYRKE